MMRKRAQRGSWKQKQSKAIVGKQRKPNYQQRAGILGEAQQKGGQCYHKKKINATHENEPKNKSQKNTTCRYCKSPPETQKHIIEECKETPWTNEEHHCKNIFQNKDVHVLETMANRIIKIVENIETHNEDQTSWAPSDKPCTRISERMQHNNNNNNNNNPPHVELAQPVQFYSIRAWLLCFGWYQHWWAMRMVLSRPEYQSLAGMEVEPSIWYSSGTPYQIITPLTGA